MKTYDEERFRAIFENHFTYIRGFMRSVNRYPKKTALIDLDHHRTWNYAELDAAANRFAHALLADGLKPQDVVMYQLMNVPEFAFIYLGCQKVGVINSPINFRLSSGEIAYTIDDSKPRVFVFDLSLKSTVGEALMLCHHKPKKVVSVGEGECDFAIPYDAYVKDQPDSEPVEQFPQKAFSETTRLYTSGTTGRPKGVPVNNVNEILTCLDTITNLRLTTDDVLLNLSPWFHRGGIHIAGPAPGLYLGATIASMRAFYPKPTLDAIQKYKITVIVGVPTMYKVMLEEQKKHPRDLSSLKVLVSMGSPLDRALCIEMQEVFTRNVYNGYGTSETFWNTLLTPEELPEMAGTAGRASFFDEVRVARAYEDRLADPDDVVTKDGRQVGEVIIRTLKSTYDYFQKPEEAAKKVYKNWFYTGDLATWDEREFITIVSRKDDMIISGGENIYPVQIEEVIQEHPKVLHCAVVGVPDEVRGQAIVAYVVKKDESLTLEELKKFIASHPMLPPYKRPRYWRFVDALPMTATGKKQHYKLREQVTEDLKQGLLSR